MSGKEQPIPPLRRGGSIAKVPSHKGGDDSTPPEGPGSPVQLRGHPRGPARSFRVPDLRKAMKVVAKHGGHLEIMPDGRIIILTGHDHPTTQAGDDLDKWMAEKNARQA